MYKKHKLTQNVLSTDLIQLDDEVETSQVLVCKNLNFVMQKESYKNLERFIYRFCCKNIMLIPLKLWLMQID